ncbi:RCC1 domain-containing protein [Polychaeton citri CBS 116435]|uniref:RCC1 domain-containing protein n=1 Tax=Polychaeton citri CBS 116435 TaxID=1314669 RepID=A0A9P4QD52_9PEZI|nr:RCC1 domain-containing protein [Polychaeton citri CBS 116435]
MRLFAFGSNGSGQLGLGHEFDLSTPAPVGLQCSPKTSFYAFAAGGNHSLLLNERGECFGTGVPSHRGHDNSAEQTAVNTFSPVESPLNNAAVQVRAVSATWAASFLLKDNSVFVTGTGDSGELGLGEGIVRADVWQQLPNFPPEGSRIVQLTSCMGHTVAVVSTGQVYGWGKGRKGQLGQPAEDVWSPRKLEDVQFHVEQVVCGRDFTCLIGDSSEGRIKVLGSDGRDRFCIKANAPEAVPYWSDIAASWGSIFILEESGSVVSWGRNDRGQLPPSKLPAIIKLAAGSEHCLAITEDGKLLAWGWGEHGNCGEPTNASGNVQGHWNEIQVPGKVHSVFAGCATSFVLAEDD